MEKKINKVAGDAMKKLIEFCATEKMLNPKIVMEASTGEENYRLTFERIDLKEEKDELFEKAKQLAIETRFMSSSLLMRKFQLGYNRAGRIMDQLENHKIISPFEGSKDRRVLI